MNLNKVFVVVAVLCTTLAYGEERNWSYELISIKATTSNAELADISVKEKRIGRGMYAFSGFLDFKMDLDDTTLVDVRVYRSSTEREQDYQATPFVIKDEILTNFMNVHYKSYIMEDVKECAPAAPQFDPADDFVPPISKVRIEVENCNVPIDGYPDIMEYGLYKIEAFVRNEIEMKLEIVVKVEPK